jgi:hypothetical protein
VKLAVFRYRNAGPNAPDRIMGLVDEEVEALITGVPAPPPPPDDRTVEGSSSRPDPDDDDPDEDDDVVYPLKIYDPVEFYVILMPAASELDPNVTQGWIAMDIPKPLSESEAFVHYDAMRTSGVYSLESAEPCVAEYRAGRERRGVTPGATAQGGGRRRITS